MTATLFACLQLHHKWHMLMREVDDANVAAARSASKAVQLAATAMGDVDPSTRGASAHRDAFVAAAQDLPKHSRAVNFWAVSFRTPDVQRVNNSSAEFSILPHPAGFVQRTSTKSKSEMAAFLDSYQCALEARHALGVTHTLAASDCSKRPIRLERFWCPAVVRTSAGEQGFVCLPVGKLGTTYKPRMVLFPLPVVTAFVVAVPGGRFANDVPGQQHAWDNLRHMMVGEMPEDCSALLLARVLVPTSRRMTRVGGALMAGQTYRSIQVALVDFCEEGEEPGESLPAGAVLRSALVALPLSGVWNSVPPACPPNSHNVVPVAMGVDGTAAGHLVLCGPGTVMSSAPWWQDPALVALASKGLPLIAGALHRRNGLVQGDRVVGGERNLVSEKESLDQVLGKLAGSEAAHMVSEGMREELAEREVDVPLQPEQAFLEWKKAARKTFQRKDFFDLGSHRRANRREVFGEPLEEETLALPYYAGDGAAAARSASAGDASGSFGEGPPLSTLDVVCRSVSSVHLFFSQLFFWMVFRRTGTRRGMHCRRLAKIP